MILAFLLLQAAAPPPAVADEVTVIGERLKTWRASFQVKKGKASCTVRQSSGDAAIDAIGCDAMTGCWPLHAAQFDASQAKGLAKAEHKTRLAAAEQAFGTCMAARRTAGIAALAAQRAGS